MKKIGPRLAFKVPNRLNEDDTKINVELNFESMDDFSPENVARQVKPLNELLELRTRLSDLRGSLQGNDKLDDLLQAALRDSAQLDKLKAEIAQGKGEAQPTGEKEGSNA